MATLQALAIALFISSVAFHQCLVNAQFYESMYINWGAHHSSILGNGEELELVLDQTSGSGVQSYQAFLFGSTEMLIKLVPGNSAGTVTAYYVSAACFKKTDYNRRWIQKIYIIAGALSSISKILMTKKRQILFYEGTCSSAPYWICL